MDLSGNDTGEGGGGRSHEPLSRSKSSQGNLQMSNGLPSLPSNDPTVSHPPLKGQRSLSPHHNLLDQIVPSESSSNQKLSETTNKKRVRSFPEENLSRTNILSPTQQQTFNTPQFHRKDVPPSSVGGIGIITIPQDGQSTVEPHGNHHHQPRIPPGLIPSNRMPNWSHPGVVHGPIVVPNSIPIYRGRVQHPVLATYGPINGLVRSPAGLAQIGIRYPVNPTLQGIPLQSTTPIPTITRLTSPPFTCYNCGSQGHQGSKCVSSLSENSSMKGKKSSLYIHENCYGNVQINLFVQLPKSNSGADSGFEIKGGAVISIVVGGLWAPENSNMVQSGSHTNSLTTYINYIYYSCMYSKYFLILSINEYLSC